MPYFVYILQSEKNGSYYKGFSENVIRRLEEHNSGKELSTARYKPWKLVWFCKKQTRSEAISLEKKLKNITGKKKTENFIRKHGVGGPDAATG